MSRDEIDRARMRACVGLVILGGISAACQGKVLPLSAQAGSTVMIALQGPFDPDAVGYGGTEVVDYQRGELVYQLDGPGGFELVTRGTGSSVAWPGTATARGSGVAFLTGPVEIVSLVDVPASAPLGTHDLHVVRRRFESGGPVDYAGPDYNGQISILPNQIEVPLAGGGSETVTGAPTPFEAWFCPPFGPDPCDWQAVSAVPDATPDPELRITLSQDVWAVELEVTYPAGVIDVVDAFEAPRTKAVHLARVWMTTVDADTVVVSAVAGAEKFRRVSIAFTLDDGAAEILDPNDVAVTVLEASNQNGQSLSPTVTSKLIF